MQLSANSQTISVQFRSQSVLEVKVRAHMLCFPGRKNAAVCDNVTLRDGGSVQGSHCIIIPVTACS